MYSRFAPAGLNIVVCPCETIAGRLSLRIQQLEVVCETKTRDNVFIKVVVAVQYRVIENEVHSAFYKLTDPSAQIQSYVYDIVRSTFPRMDLDQSFTAKQEIAKEVDESLAHTMKEFGYDIIQCLIIDIDPDRRVKDAMDEINASRRLRFAAEQKAEAEKIQLVKNAEAEAESKYLSGVGVARQRAAIIDGLKGSIGDFAANVAGSNPKEVMNLLLLTQYFDMLRDVGSKHAPRSLFLPHSPNAIADLKTQIRSALDSTLN